MKRTKPPVERYLPENLAIHIFSIITFLFSQEKDKYMRLMKIIIFMLLVLYIGIFCKKPFKDVIIEDYSLINRLPKINPDYTGLIIPPNIAPMNFIIDESGVQYSVKIRTVVNNEITIFSRNPKIVIPLKKWEEILTKNKGKNIFLIFL